MPISSLPSEYGIGNLGAHAFRFADFLSSCKVSIWQVLPAGPTGYGDSPYQSFSVFAGNPYFIDPEILANEGLLKRDELPVYADAERVDYGRLYRERFVTLRRAYDRIGEVYKEKIAEFSERNEWLGDYALFMSLKERFGGKPWTEWDDGIRLRLPGEMDKYRKELADSIGFQKFMQYVFSVQWGKLRRYINSLGISLLGDMPIYAALDSADAWSHPELFLMDSDKRLTKVAGVPPDYFSADGQLWGNPLYDWEYHKKTGYAWWISRMKKNAEYFDIVRIDHFIGFANYYSVDAGAPNARNGEWVDGPGYPLFEAVEKAVPELTLVAEDLGIISDKVKSLLDKCGYPGMNVLQFAFSGDENNPHLPKNIGENRIVYTGTHDNDTSASWAEGLDEATRTRVLEIIGTKSRRNVTRALIKAAYKTEAHTVIIPMWDFLSLGSEARMNTPGTVGGNWCWRLPEGLITAPLRDGILRCNKNYKRIPE